MHLLRGALAVVVLGGFIYAVRALSLANAYAVFLSAPLLVTALAVPLLKERADARNWFAILVGLVGVLDHAAAERRRAGEHRGTGSARLAPAPTRSAASPCGCLPAPTRTVSVVFWTFGFMTVFSGLLAAPGWVPLEHAHLRWLLLLGCWPRSRNTC